MILSASLAGNPGRSWVLAPVFAIVRLTTRQLLGGRRFYGIFLALGLPLAFAFLITRLTGRLPRFDPSDGYTVLYAMLLMGLFMPFLAVYWGASILTDEIDGKTLVFLFTRPAGRARIMILKFLVAIFWLGVVIAVAVVGLHTIAFHTVPARENYIPPSSTVALQTMLWDARALYLGAICYAAFVFCLSAIFKRPLLIGLVYVYTIDVVTSFVPGFLKRISVRQYVARLSTHTSNDAEGGLGKAGQKLTELLADTPLTEFEAIATLILASAAFVLLGAFLIRSREFLGDDPARNQ